MGHIAGAAAGGHAVQGSLYDRIGFGMDGLDPGRMVDMGDRRQRRPGNEELLDTEQLLLRRIQPHVLQCSDFL